MQKLTAENYVTIQGWMITELGLKGNELIIYAIIYGFSQNLDDQLFSGSITYLCEWTHLSRQAVIRILKNLVNSGLLERVEDVSNGFLLVRYHACSGSQKSLPGVVKKVDGGSQKSLPGVVKKVDGGSQKSLPDNNNYIYIDNKEDSKKENTKKENSPSSDVERILSEFIIDERVKDTIRDFMKMRKLIKAPMTDTAIKLMINKLRNMTLNPDEQIAILNQSIENSWKGIFPLKDSESGRSRAADELNQSYAMMAAWAGKE